MTTQYQGWCLTHFGAEEKLKETIIDKMHEETLSFAVYQVEICPSSGKEHQQCFIYTTKKKTFGGIKKMFSKLDNPHIERMRGTVDQARAYCMKDETRKPGTVPQQFGEVPLHRGEQKSLKPMWAAIKAGSSARKIMEDFPEEYSRYRNGVKDLIAARDKEGKKGKMPEVYVIWGPSGVGKSHRARALVNNQHSAGGASPPVGTVERTRECASVTYNNGFLTGYSGERAMIINEFKGQMPLETLLQICDKWDYVANIKGGEVPMLAEIIVITSPCHPRHWYPEHEEKGQLKRRFKQVIQLTKPQQDVHEWNDVTEINS